MVESGGNTMKKTFNNMTDNELSDYLKDYARYRSGEIADLTYAASVRIAILSAKVKELEKDMR